MPADQTIGLANIFQGGPAHRRRDTLSSPLFPEYASHGFPSSPEPHRLSVTPPPLFRFSPHSFTRIFSPSHVPETRMMGNGPISQPGDPRPRTETPRCHNPSQVIGLSNSGASSASLPPPIIHSPLSLSLLTSRP
ncbi:hypothetical protein LZ32DRAFT_129099 [Colletotrichum eremochloae]|nr:hypothetical protein LZ32DRAFT_129099 [Colletotrichum eremochloae]